MPIRKMSRSLQFVLVAGMVTLVALLIAWVDIHSSDFEPAQTWIYVLISAVLGLARPKLLWLWPFVFAFTLYGVHVWAIRHGYQQPFVERNEDRAVCCLSYAFPPCLLGSLVGGGLGAFCAFLDR